MSACRFCAVASGRRRRRAAAGFTLVELLIACALMAVLSVISFKGLDALMKTRDALAVDTDDLRAVTLAFSQLEDDLVRAYPVKDLLRLGEPSIRIGLEGGDARPTLYLLREVNRTGFPTRIQRVVYQVQDGQLVRGFGPWTQVASEGAQAGGTVRAMAWQPVVARVRGMAFRAYVDRRGWLGASELGTANATDSSGSQGTEQARRAAETQAETTGVGQLAALANAPRIAGVELTLTRADGRQFTRVYNVRD